jgi:hypothetical protein
MILATLLLTVLIYGHMKEVNTPAAVIQYYRENARFMRLGEHQVVAYVKIAVHAAEETIMITGASLGGQPYLSSLDQPRASPEDVPPSMKELTFYVHRDLDVIVPGLQMQFIELAFSLNNIPPSAQTFDRSLALFSNGAKVAERTLTFTEQKVK